MLLGLIQPQRATKPASSAPVPFTLTPFNSCAYSDAHVAFMTPKDSDKEVEALPSRGIYCKEQIMGSL